MNGSISSAHGLAALQNSSFRTNEGARLVVFAYNPSVWQVCAHFAVCVINQRLVEDGGIPPSETSSRTGHQHQRAEDEHGSTWARQVKSRR